MPLNVVPREGTAIREIYDFFQSNKGVPVSFKIPRNKHAIEALIDFYGLDVRCLHNGRGRGGSMWVLAGEWFGKTYVDYICNHLEDA